MEKESKQYSAKQCWHLNCSECIVFDDVVGKRLAVCPFFKRVLFSRGNSPYSYNCWNMCFLDKGHCGSGGKRLKFASYGVDSLRVVWICPRIVDFSFLEGY
jgi:hypothetical protein